MKLLPHEGNLLQLTEAQLRRHQRSTGRRDLRPGLTDANLIHTDMRTATQRQATHDARAVSARAGGHEIRRIFRAAGRRGINPDRDDIIPRPFHVFILRNHQNRAQPDVRAIARAEECGTRRRRAAGIFDRADFDATAVQQIDAKHLTAVGGAPNREQRRTFAACRQPGRTFNAQQKRAIQHAAGLLGPRTSRSAHAIERRRGGSAMHAIADACFNAHMIERARADGELALAVFPGRSARGIAEFLAIRIIKALVKQQRRVRGPQRQREQEHEQRFAAQPGERRTKLSNGCFHRL